VHLLSLLLMFVNLSPASVSVSGAHSQPNHVILADGPQYPPIVIGVPIDPDDGPEYPPSH
jgi:hypothetical protein